MNHASHPQAPPVTLTVAGSDSGGGAGIQADLKTFTTLSCYPTTAITALTAQNTTGVQAVSTIEPAMVAQQITSVTGDTTVAATKTGMLANEPIITTVARTLAEETIGPLVVDPVMVAKSGDALIDEAAVRALARQLMPQARVATPNRAEAARLLDRASLPATVAEAEQCAAAICRDFGCGGCVVKGIVTDGQAVDVLWDALEQKAHHVSAVCRSADHTHGSGCGFSAAIAAYLARGHSLPAAVENAKAFIDRAIAGAPSIGQGRRPVHPPAFADG